jgi:hypothetical protein
VTKNIIALVLCLAYLLNIQYYSMLISP